MLSYSVICCKYMQEFRMTNDEEAAVLAASKAAFTVIDAADAVEVSR